MQYIKLKKQAEEVDLFSDDEVEEGTQPISHEDYERLIQYLEKIYAHSTRKAKRDSARLLDKVASNA